MPCHLGIGHLGVGILSVSDCFGQMEQLRPVVTFGSPASNSATITCCVKPPPKITEYLIRRRTLALAAGASLLLVTESALAPYAAKGMRLGDDGLRVPDFSFEEAQRGIRGHAKSLLQVKDLLDSGSWRNAQKELRRSSSNLKLDIYSIIQGKPVSERPQLRKLYADLFNSITKLDYAARDEDVPRVQQLYGNIVAVMEDILSRI